MVVGTDDVLHIGVDVTEATVVGDIVQAHRHADRKEGVGGGVYAAAAEHVDGGRGADLIVAVTEQDRTARLGVDPVVAPPVRMNAGPMDVTPTESSPLSVTTRILDTPCSGQTTRA